jgi:hypothetical protein
MRISTPGNTIEIPNVDPRPPQPDDMLLLALDTLRLKPLNGMRHPPESGISGWYVWGGEEFSQAADFFSPVQVGQIGDYVPNIQALLELPPAFRFRIDDGGKTKVWIDGSLLDV